jgi:hypothetical protein
MATQTVEFQAPSGLTLTAKLFTAGSDTVAYTASAVTEGTNRKGVYAATFSSVDSNTYQLIAMDGTDAVAIWWGFADDTASTFQFGERIGVINSSTYQFPTIVGTVVARNSMTTLEAFVGETYTHTITTVDADGNAVDCSGLTLEVIIEKLDRTDVVTIANASISKTSTTVSFAVASTYHTTEANYRWALRRTDTGVVIMQGPYVVHYAADN